MRRMPRIEMPGVEMETRDVANDAPMVAASGTNPESPTHLGNLALGSPDSNRN